MRLVDAVVLHEGPIDFAVLAERVITNATRYLVLDLDRTVHLGRNMGELLGWEIGALRAYGAEELVRMEETRGRGRLLFDPSRPLGSMRYFAEGARTWALPGLYYLFFGKIPARSDLLREWTFRRFGPEPVRTVQRVPQQTLLDLVATVPAEMLRTLAERIWDRHAADQVIRRDHLDRLRERHPDLRVVISSASPRVVVEVARDRLGADLVYCSEHDHINSGPAKITRFAEQLPEVLDPRIETVGVTDTGYGEDHCWREHFTRVVDVNSDSPFPPLVGVRSPVREIHSAQLITRGEWRARLRGDTDWLDARRPGVSRLEARVIRAAELRERLGDLNERANVLGAAPEANAWALAELAREARRRLDVEAPVNAPGELPEAWLAPALA